MLSLSIQCNAFINRKQRQFNVGGSFNEVSRKIINLLSYTLRKRDELV